MRRWTTLLSFVAVALGGCHSNSRVSPVQGIEVYGLVESPVDHPALEAAVRNANLILGPSSATSFAAGWRQVPNTSAIKVFAADPKGLGETEVMSSYHQCNCVIAQVGRMSAWLSQQTGTGQGLLSVDNQSLMTYMLLHEMGHIAHGDEVESETPSTNTGQAMKFNLDPTLQKEHEIAADQYAANAINAAIKDKGSNRGIAAAQIAVTLAQLSWNLAEHRLLDNFGGTAVHAPSLFFDAGLSHPNLEWRILSVNAAISDAPTAQKLLSDFENLRQVQPTVLYQAKPH